MHWRVGADAIHLADPRSLELDEPASRTLFDAVRPLFESEGFALHWGAPLRWYASHADLAAMPTASLDRVVGRSIDRWLPAEPSARLVRRLQNEVQMLLYTHPVNIEREAAGALTVNSFWLSGCGVLQRDAKYDVQVDDRLTAARAGRRLARVVGGVARARCVDAADAAAAVADAVRRAQRDHFRAHRAAAVAARGVSVQRPARGA